MEKLLRQIVVVVDFSDHCRMVLNDIIPMANEMQYDVHLLHVMKPAMLPVSVDTGSLISFRSDQEAAASLKLMQLQSHYLPQLAKGRLIICHSAEGPMEKVIRDYSIRHHIDLVILMQHSPYPWSNFLHRININRLADKVQCPILNLPPPGTLHQIHNIVLPVTNVLPLRKIMFATYLARYTNACIHLVALNGTAAGQELNDQACLFKTYQLLKDNTNLAIECHPIDGYNIADTTLEYAEKVKADLIVIEPGKEATLPGFLNNIFSRFLFSASRIPVMAV